MPGDAAMLFEDIQHYLTRINALRGYLAKEGYEISFLDNGKGLV